MSHSPVAIDRALDQLESYYASAVSALRGALQHYLTSGELPDNETRQSGLFCYPELVLHWQGEQIPIQRVRAWGRFTHAGTYSATVTQPALFRRYLTEQLEMLSHEYQFTLEVRPSNVEIPYPYVIDGLGLTIERPQMAAMTRYFPTTDLANIGDDISDGLITHEQEFPLGQFEALRVDFSLARLKHYTGTPAESFQPYILFTNYTRYVDEFIRWGKQQVADPNSPYVALVCAGGNVINADNVNQELSQDAWKKHQMPAWHLITEDQQGISLINIGVGPSNAKTICDHLAVLRPHAWLMIGHCGGLRESQRIGDYVLAHAYLRDDHVLDSVLPADIPVPSIAEVQRALYDATRHVYGDEDSLSIKQRLRTGTVVTTDDRNWELRYAASALRFNLSRAIAVDMESATIAAQGYRFRVPYGTLLCVSDKPLHGEIKLPGQANRFYDGAISEHLQIGICAVDLLRAEGDKLHSRKLRTFVEPPFR
ncbi:AMP nucleosidase [Rosenbergiella australiborealis]|uniref:AMP nucleosidase n=1 Tax=Rosenbergiella australiborealis TaxID=1544696 RepID=UPI001F4ED30E|nr:AMP nucleosidase [Rosenbergiella australiborealis]